MKLRNAFGPLVGGALVVVAAGSGAARGAAPAARAVPAGAWASPGAQAVWFIETVDWEGDVGQYASAAAGPSWAPASVRYYDATNRDLDAAWRPFASGAGNCGEHNDWACYSVDDGEDVGEYCSHAMMFDGTSVTAYHDAANRALKVKYSMFDAGMIDQVIEPATTGTFTSAAFDPEGTPFVAYHFNNPGNVDALMIAYRAEGEGNCGVGEHAGHWNCFTVQTGEGVGQHTSLALDGDGHFHIAYQDAANGDLWYATSRSAVNCGPGNGWHCYPVDATSAVVGQYASIYVDDEDNFHIAYYDDTNDVLKYATYVGSDGNCAGGQAQCDEIDDMMQGYNPLGVSIADDGTGRPFIAYQSQDAELNVARPLAALGMPAGSGNCGPGMPFATWHCETIDPINPWLPAYRNGDYISLDVNSGGIATIAYYGFIRPDDGDLMVAYQRALIYMPVILTSQDGGGQQTRPTSVCGQRRRVADPPYIGVWPEEAGS